MIEKIGMKKIKEAGKFIKQEIDRNKKVYLFGDGDLDGIAGVLILEEALQFFGAQTVSIFSNRQEWGYGISDHYFNLLKEKEPGLLISVDLGIGNYKNISQLRKIGFSVVIIDHHGLTTKTPKANIIVNPQLEKKSVFHNLCAASLCYILASNLLQKDDFESKNENFLELAMLATLSDKMPEDEENERIIKQGIEALKSTERPFFLAILEQISVSDDNLSRQEIESRFLPLISACQMRGEKSHAYLFLKEKKQAKAQKIVELLIQKRKFQKARTEEIVAEVTEKKEPGFGFILNGNVDWPLVLCARAASILARGFNMPVFLYHHGKEISQGSARCPSDFDLLEILDSCSKFFINWGGHKQAAGFGIENKNLEKFNKCLINFFRKEK